MIDPPEWTGRIMHRPVPRPADMALKFYVHGYITAAQFCEMRRIEKASKRRRRWFTWRG